MSTLLLTLRESVRYRGRSGHWSWIAHRLSGLAILSFLLIHVWDTANATYAPAVYEWSVALFKHPLFGVGEIGIPFTGAAIANAFAALTGGRLRHLPFNSANVRHALRQGGGGV